MFVIRLASRENGALSTWAAAATALRNPSRPT
jgi:hypothetical protein